MKTLLLVGIFILLAFFFWASLAFLLVALILPSAPLVAGSLFSLCASAFLIHLFIARSH